MRFLFWGTLVILVLVRIFLTKPTYPEGKMVRVTGTVREEPIKYDYQQKINLLGLKVFLPRFPEISYGDKIIVEGRVKEGKLEKANLVRLERSPGLLVKVREKIIGFYKKSLPEPHASLVAGITLGAKGEIPALFWKELTETGLAHVVVASGSNVSLVGGFLLGVFTLFFARGVVIPLILTAIWLYAVLAGLEAPIIRAAVMGSIAFGAQAAGKLASAWRALILTALVMLIIKPEWLGDLGFILSFVATSCLILFQRRIEKFFKKVPDILREGLASSLAAQIGVTPILFVTFGQFNLLSPVANALVLWTVPLIMAISGVAGLLGLIFPGLGRLVLYLAYPLTGWFIFINTLFSK